MSVPRVVIVVRHAQSEHHVRGLTGGWTDTELTERGHGQARRVAARLGEELRGVPVTLHTSDLKRAAQTAAHIGAALGVQPTPDARLREHNNGECANLTVEEAKARYPESFNQFWELDTRPFPGAETWREMHARVGEFMESLPSEGPVPLLVTHGGLLMTMVSWWLRLDMERVNRSWFGVYPASLTTLHSDDWQMRGLQTLNDTAHLDPADRPPLLPP